MAGRMKHWLHDTNYYNSGTLDYSGGSEGLSQTLSFEAEPTTDGANVGQATWYDYDGKPDTYHVGTDSLPSLATRVLPDGTTWYTWYQRDSLGRPTQVVDTYSTAFGAAPQTRTNIYVYSGADLVAHTGPNGNVEDGYAYNGNHQLTFYTNAVGDVTYYTYDSKGRLTGTRTPAGLTTTNIYFPSGGDTNFVQ